jgi:nitroreductase
MDLFEAIKERHSYRLGFKETPIPEEDLRRIVQAGLDAPSGCNAQTTRFVIVNDPEKVQSISELSIHNRKAMKQAKAYILICLEKNPTHSYKNMSFQVEDSAAAVENMLLAITALGYGSVWIDGWLRTDNHAEEIAKCISLPEHMQLRIILPIGVPAETAQRKEKMTFDERCCFNTYTL